MNIAELAAYLDGRIARLEAITPARKGTRPLTRGQEIELATLQEIRNRIGEGER